MAKITDNYDVKEELGKYVPFPLIKRIFLLTLIKGEHFQ